ncbi:MAG: EscU/YscU/HrcU family type III secretion system export apparatus switch protein [Clostridiaceae bacterium]|nr:EscU/YscU/HrcU family type III secretion system export apparatus switch protein [Clostridiaceae bacterium]
MDGQKRKKLPGEIIEAVQDKTAIALEYDGEEDIAPKVVASGKGYVAEKILDAAQQNDIPVHKDEALAKSLSSLEIGEYIPKELYQVVAEVLVYVDAMDKIKGKVMKRKEGLDHRGK